MPPGWRRYARWHGRQRDKTMRRASAAGPINVNEPETLLTQEFGVPGHAIGTIDINRAYMHFDVTPAFSKAIRTELEEFTINGRKVRVDEASPRKEGGGGFGGGERRGGGGGGDRFGGKKPAGKWDSGGSKEGGKRKRY